MKKRRIYRVLKIALIGTLAIGIFGFLTMELWNWLMPALFGWHPLSFWKALGLLVLCRILFGGFRGGPGHGMHWRRRIRERWAVMTPEEREKFRHGLGTEVGLCPPEEQAAKQ